MATTAAQKRATAPADEDQAPDTSAAANRRIRELEAELAKIRADAVEAEQNKPPKDTHVLVLANGEQVRTAAPVATHHYSERDEITVPVVSVFELGEEV